MDMVGQQFGQHDYVLQLLNNKRNGFFVDFGAWDGISFSNTYFLEKDYGWTGIIAEGDPQAHDRLTKNRPNTKIDKRVVWRESNQWIEFNSVAGGKLSGVNEVMEYGHPKTFTRKRTKNVLLTVSLDDLLDEHEAPDHIDFISIDVEGSEYPILEGYSFKRKPSIFCIEHWFDYEKIKQIMQDNGYIHHVNEASWWQEMNRCIESYFLHPSLVDDVFMEKIKKTNEKFESLKPVTPEEVLKKRGLK